MINIKGEENGRDSAFPSDENDAISRAAILTIGCTKKSDTL